jgi:aspartate aminotransferase
VYVDGISKALAATGVRVGWIVAPPDLAKPMSGLLGHMGAWAPKAEQSAVASYLDDPGTVAADRADLVAGVRQRLDALYDGLVAMRDDGLPVDVIAPEGAIYLSVRFGLDGRMLADGTRLDGDEAIRAYLLRAAGLAVVPFSAFGVRGDCGWFRLSVGAVSLPLIAVMLPRLRTALAIT